jgi:two-component system chemotaxis sensor kinase CheA
MIDSETREMILSFVSESLDSLDTSEPIVESLRSEDSADSVNAIFRVFHTMKGVSGFFEMHVINRVTHQAETLLDIMRKQNLVQSEETLTVIYQLYDFLRDLLHRVGQDLNDTSGAEEAEDMILIIQDALEKVINQAGENPSDIPDSEQEYPMSPDTVLDQAMTEPEAREEEPCNTDLDFSFAQDAEAQNENETGPAGVTTQEEEIDYDKLVSNEMVAQYLSSANELLDTAEKNLLELEKEPDNMQIIGSTFGVVHSLKGNSGFMGYSEIEEIAIEMGTILDCFRSRLLSQIQP